MLNEIVRVEPLDGYRLRLWFDDGTEGIVDIAKCVSFTGVFAPLADRTEFSRVTVNAELGTVVWPCGADLDPDVLHAQITGETLPATRR
ncbi:MAG: DUF2442 domain-containing protein [Pirellulales bacterium]|nr:DUF2442 domain-containing protein [Pirellulales bacterium]